MTRREIGQLAPPPAKRPRPRARGQALVDQAVAVYKRLFDPTSNGGLRRAPGVPLEHSSRACSPRARADAGDAGRWRMAALTLQKMASGRDVRPAGRRVPPLLDGRRDPAGAALREDALRQRVAGGRLLRGVPGDRAPRLRARHTRDARLPRARDDGAGRRPLLGHRRRLGGARRRVRKRGVLRLVARRRDRRCWRRALGEDRRGSIAHYGVTTEGSFEGANILHVARPDEGAWAALAGARAALYAVRAKRPPPLRDEKILAAWNGLAISGFAVAGRVLGEPRYVDRRRARRVRSSSTMRPQDSAWREAGRTGAPRRDASSWRNYAFLTARPAGPLPRATVRPALAGGRATPPLAERDRAAASPTPPAAGS